MNTGVDATSPSTGLGQTNNFGFGQPSNAGFGRAKNHVFGAPPTIESGQLYSSFFWSDTKKHN